MLALLKRHKAWKRHLQSSTIELSFQEIYRFSIAISLGSVIMDSKDTTTRFVHFAPVLALIVSYSVIENENFMNLLLYPHDIFCFREGSIVAEMVVTVLKHRYAEDFFNASFSALDLASLFPWSIKSYYQDICKFYHHCPNLIFLDLI